MIYFEEIIEFTKDIKKLKKFRSINLDIDKFKKALLARLSEDPNSVLPGTEKIERLGKKVKVSIYKVTHFRCESLKGKGSRSGIRVIYAFKKEEEKVTLIEIYSKNKKANEDKVRILKYFEEK